MSKADEMRRSIGGGLRETVSHRPPPVGLPAMAMGTALAGERMQGVQRSKASMEIAVDRIDRDLGQPREFFDQAELDRLAESIRRRGVRVRISVRWSEECQRYLVVAGERRWRAAAMAGLATIPCDVIEGDLSAEDILVIQGIENLIRDDLKPIEQAKLFRTLLAANNWTQAALSAEFGISQPTISQTLSLLELAPDVQARVESGQLAATVAAEVASKLGDHDDQREVVDRIVSGGLTRPEAVREVREAAARPAKSTSGKGRGAKVKSAPRALVVRTPHGRVTVENRRGIDHASALAALRDATAQVEARAAAETA